MCFWLQTANQRATTKPRHDKCAHKMNRLDGRGGNWQYTLSYAYVVCSVAHEAKTVVRFYMEAVKCANMLSWKLTVFRWLPSAFTAMYIWTDKENRCSESEQEWKRGAIRAHTQFSVCCKSCALFYLCNMRRKRKYCAIDVSVLWIYFVRSEYIQHEETMGVIWLSF